MKCCLGFVGQQCGIPNAALDGVATPESCTEQKKYPRWLVKKGQTEACGKAVTINDDSDLTDAEREAKLRALFRKHGDQIVFRP